MLGCLCRARRSLAYDLELLRTLAVAAASSRGWGR